MLLPASTPILWVPPGVVREPENPPEGPRFVYWSSTWGRPTDWFEYARQLRLLRDGVSVTT